MKKTDFLTLLKNELEIENSTFSLNSKFDEIDDFSSLSVLTLIALADTHFDVKFSAKEIQEMNTIDDFMKKIGIEKFE